MGQVLFEFFLYLNRITRYFRSVEQVEPVEAAAAAAEPEVVYEAASLR